MIHSAFHRNFRSFCLNSKYPHIGSIFIQFCPKGKSSVGISCIDISSFCEVCNSMAFEELISVTTKVFRIQAVSKLVVKEEVFDVQLEVSALNFEM